MPETLVAAVGDLVVMRPLAHVHEPPEDSLLHVTSQAGLALGNLEVPLTDIDDPQHDGFTLRADADLIPDVASLGLHALSLANNHCGDHGWAALRHLGDDLADHGIQPLGIGDDRDAALGPVVKRADGLDIAIVTATCVGRQSTFATPERPGMSGVEIATAYQPDLARATWEPGTPARTLTVAHPEDGVPLLAAVRRARALTPAVLAVVHWGVSYADRPEIYQHVLGRQLIDAGASAVFGCHSHTVQGIEVHRGAPIFHGLGSFVFGYAGPLAARMPRDTAVAQVTLAEDGRVTGARLLLGRLNDAGEPVRAHPERARLLAEALARHSAGWGASTRLDGDILHLSL